MNRILRKIVKELSANNDVRAIILYGSFARKEATSRSDIDLFIIVTAKKAARALEDTIIGLEPEIGRNIQPTIRTLDQLKKTDSGLLQNIFQEGRILYLKEPTDIPSSMMLEHKPQLIYTFQINNLTQNEKARFNNEFYGRAKGKYRYQGLLGEINGQKLSSGCVLLPHSGKQVIERFLKKFKIRHNQLKVWK